MRVILLNGLLLLFVGLAQGASFYGDGFVQLKGTESSSRNTLHIRFRTSSPSGLLFLAAGQNDFLLLEMNAGRLQVRLDLGSGEQILLSDSGTQLNDLAWHTAELLHDIHNVTMTVDNHSKTTLQMPGPERVLHINDGLYVGGSGGLDKTYLFRDLSGFRGCLDEVIFNQHNLLSSLRPYSGFKNVYEVSLGCSPQFFANEDDPISFFSSQAYISLPPWTAQHEWTFECSFHTSAEEGIIMYNSARQGDFVALEIQKGLLVALIGKDGSKTELRSLTFINDRRWHNVKLFFTPKSLQLTVDGESVKSTISSRSKTFHLKGFLFVGGIDDSTRSEVRKVGLASVAGKRVRGGSFKGCFRDIKINYVKMGLPSAVVTKDISVGCEPEKELDISTTVSPITLSSDSVTQLPPTDVSTLAKGLVKKYGHNFLQLRNLVVPEGGRGSLESKHIKVNLDFKKLGIRQSQIIFRIEEQPVHGQLRLDVDQEQAEHTFSMLDLWHGRAMYIHGGSEDPQDFFMFSVFSNSRKEVPGYLKRHKLYRFNITVTPTNDAPELSLPEGNLFILMENSKKKLTTDVLKAIDIDSNYTDLVYSVLGNLNADAGYLENEDNPGTSLNSFSHAALVDGKIHYVHTGVRNSRIVLRVSDGEKVSNTVVLRIMAVALEYKISNNTGLEVTQGEMYLISTNQLAVWTNALKQVVDIRYDVIEPPKFGELQRMHSSGEWKITSSFSQRVLEKGRLRYLSTYQSIQTSNSTDHFKCKVTVASRASEELAFPITVKWINYTIENNKPVELDKITRAVIDSDHLYVKANGVSLTDDELCFKLLTLPRRGIIEVKNAKLDLNSTFCQRDITDLKVEYQLLERSFEDTTDEFVFHIFSKHAHSASHIFTINIKADVNSIFMTNNGLSLLEGESKLITKNELFAETLSTKEIYYTITKTPNHGKLMRINLSNSTKDFDKIMSFTNQDVLEERIMYVHDDSETTQDDFTFIASTSPVAKLYVRENDVGSKEGVFNISIKLVNDEKPTRIVDKVFNVVRNKQRLLTLEDLCYHDSDSDFSDGELVYTRRGIPMGDLVLVNDTSHKLYQFRQEDLEQKRVLFIHHGMNSGRFVLFVSDGKHYVSSLLDISAQDAYLKIGNNTGLLIQKGQAKMLCHANLSVDTNLDIRNDNEITFKIQKPPKHGSLYLNNSKTESFTQNDLRNCFLSYYHDNSNNLADVFTLLVEAKDLQLDVKVPVKVYLESHQRPPIILHNKTLLVEEGKPVKIESSKLKVTHEASSPSEITFTVKVPPSHGHLRHFIEGKDQYQGTKEDPLVTFSQWDVNAGNIQYMQVDPGQNSDSFTLEASNGVAEVIDIIMSVDIIPRLIPIEVSNITLKEGASKALTEDIIKVTNPHFSGLNFVYYVSEGPLHGHIENLRFRGIPTTYFTRKQVEQEFIYYVHDNTETLEDHFTITANDTDLRKHSAPWTVYVQIIAVNDQPPVITANRVLRVWVDSVTEITPEDLNAQDEDTLPEQLEYIITQPSNGHLALKTSPNRPIMNFTQAHIDQRQLLFVHSGPMAGGFNFQVNDGVNFASRQIFSITARALVLNLKKAGPLKVFPGSLSLISNNILQATTNDDTGFSNRTIDFTVINLPKFGKLVGLQADKTTTEISSFTQQMVDDGEVAYQQNHVTSLGWAALDKFTFTVSSPPAMLESQTFDIDISYENVGPEQSSVLLVNKGVEVAEGDKVLIDKSTLDASNLLTKQPESKRSSYEIWYQVTSLPQHGVIVVGERNLTKEKPNFSQFILNKYGITYHHDNSETTYDHFEFDVYLNLKSKPPSRPLDTSEVVSESFNITIIPINDQPPVLKTKTPSLKVVQGDTVTIGPDNLNVVDLDNPPTEIQYTVISKPGNGFLAIADHLNESVDSFSQAQINNGEVFFIHDGSSSSGAFYFSVTDGHHRPLYKLFNLEVIKITVWLANNTEVLLDQGHTSVTLTQSHLAAVTNGKNTTVHYQITVPPKNGKLLLNNDVVTAFSHDDLEAETLMYHMVNLESSHDNFEFAAFTTEANLTNQVVNITVKPLIKYTERVTFPNGIRIRLKPHFLNVSELALLSDSDPLFEITSPPDNGKIVRMIGGKGRKAESVESFTFSELLQQKLAIELKANLTGVQEVNDSFRFVLKANNVQPANGIFTFSIVPHVPTMEISTVTAMSTIRPVFHSQTAALSLFTSSTSPAVQPTQRVTKSGSRFKGRNRWGNSNSIDIGTTNSKTTHGVEEISPINNTPVKVESVSQTGSSSNSMIILLPLLALLLLVIIVVVLGLLLRPKWRKKPKPSKSMSGSSSQPDDLSQPELSHWPATIPVVTVTPLISRNAGSSTVTRLQTRSENSPSGPSVSLCSFGDLEPEVSQLCRTTNPTLRNNQYWV
uniref:Si:dkey-193c22.2 n=1 Tax=Danio rerio TaxID=7955 RepID=A0ACD6B6K2_DANRE|nr:chondroitin sulfate proteoglycan 4-like [Danio rerio]XP_021332245.1 chondroitin sulfate proteoglycan 4-like [Danio rerio]|eukprot:XP_005165450.1 chondroitin sulfate proteoglycan 4-like [Danio rerio]